MRRLIDFWIRWQACKMAAQCVAAWSELPDEGYCPKLWSTVVFFETYMHEGAVGTHADFGPADPVDLKEVS